MKLTNRPNPWRSLREANGHELVKKFPTSYGVWKFITVLTTAHHWYISWSKKGPVATTPAI